MSAHREPDASRRQPPARGARPHETPSSQAPGADVSEAEPGSGTPESLVGRIVAGEAAAEAELVVRYSRGVKAILRRLTRDPALVDDIHQETFLVVLRRVRAGELRTPAALAGFIRSTARNLLIADRRKGARTSELDQDELEQAARRLPADNGEDPPQLRRVMALEESQLVRRLLSELSTERDRQILLRFYLCEGSKEQVCHDLGLEPHLFNRVLFRARTRLRELWELRAAELGLKR